MRNFPNLMQQIVDKMNLTLVKPLNFKHGDYKEIVKILYEMDTNITSRALKYPLLALFDYEQTDTEQETVDSEVSAWMALITPTNKDWRADTRNTESFVKILNPIYELLMHTIRTMPKAFLHPQYRVITQNRTDVKFNSQEDKTQNLLSSIVDAIEMKNINLKIISL